MIPTSNPTPAKLPERAGVGIKPQHYAPLLEGLSAAVRPLWVEIHPQNFFHAGGPSRHWLARIADALPVSFHSTGLSLGSADGPDLHQLDMLARLMADVPAASVSDHLSWSRSGTETFPDLLPLPYTEESLDRLAASISIVQDRLGRQMLVENPSRMVAFRDDRMHEVDFLHRLCAQTGCGLLLDINNVIVSSVNTGIAVGDYLDAIDADLVGEIHLAGHTREAHDVGVIAIDDHGSPVSDECWAHYAAFIGRAGPKPTLIERDNAVPDFATLIAEVARADRILTGATHALAS